jgi:hypothetical protein
MLSVLNSEKRNTESAEDHRERKRKLHAIIMRIAGSGIVLAVALEIQGAGSAWSPPKR